MIDAVMYGMIPRKNTATFVERAAGEEVEERDDTACVRVLQFLDRAEVDVRNRDVRAEPEDPDDEDREEDLVPQVGDPEHVPQA